MRQAVAGQRVDGALDRLDVHVVSSYGCNVVNQRLEVYMCHLFPQMAASANPFEVGAADEAVVVEGVAVDARLVQRGQVCAE